MTGNFVTIQQYALKHKLSTFSVVKLINTKKIKAIKKIINGEEKEFIIDDTVTPSAPTSNEEAQAAVNYEVEFHKLLAKYLALQAKYDALVQTKELV